jgi:aspartyl-tRNA synthetase
MLRSIFNGRNFFSSTNAPIFKRSHFLGDLNENLLQKEVSLCGWVSAIRNVSRNLFFLVLRDHSGTVQLTLTRTHVDEETFLTLQEAVASKQISPESVIAIRGTVQPRPIGMKNDSMSTGSIEIFVNQFKILNQVKCKLPFTLNEKYLPSEEVRLQDRFLDLRRSEMQQVIRFRSKINQIIRSFFDQNGTSKMTIYLFYF